MNEFDYDEYEEVTKIPYDQKPIGRTPYRPYRHHQSSTPKGSSKLLSTIVAMLVIVNLVMAGLLITMFNRMKVPPVINNPTYNISSDVDGMAWVSASKAKFSTVCVSAGYSSSSGTSIDYDHFFNMSSKGAGVIVECDKTTGETVIVTCYHVIENSPSAVYVLAYDSFYPVKATVAGFSSANDIAILKVAPNNAFKASNCCSASVSDSSVLTEGQMAVAIGNPLSMGFSVTVGVVSAPLNQVNVAGTISRVIKVDAAINSGNSGGGLFDGSGNLIGIVNAKMMSEQIDSVGFAIPSNLAIGIKNSVIKNNGNPTRANLNFGVVEISKDGNTIEGETQKLEYSVIVKSITPFNNCYNGLLAGDKIVSVTANGVTRKIINLYDIDDMLIGVKTGESVTFAVDRSGTPKQFTFTVSGELAIN